MILAEPKRGKRIAMSLLAVLVIYGNVAVTFDPRKIGLGALPWVPDSFAIRDAFLIPGMFSGYTTYNFDFLLQGFRTSQGDPADRDRWIELPLSEHFPLRFPITYTYLFAAHHWDMLGESAQRAAWAVYARKIKARHNRLHPDRSINRLRISLITFPQSSDGYRAAKATKSWNYVWYADP